jgi:hypothetical protein
MLDGPFILQELYDVFSYFYETAFRGFCQTSPQYIMFAAYALLVLARALTENWNPCPTCFNHYYHKEVIQNEMKSRSVAFTCKIMEEACHHRGELK